MSTHSGMAEFLKRSMTSQSQKQPSPLPPNGKFSFSAITKPSSHGLPAKLESSPRDIWLASIYGSTTLDTESGQGKCQKVVTLLG